MSAYLVFEDGEVFPGEWIGTSRTVGGEIVFHTAMTGCQEVMTDPSCTGQILVFTYPLIGNCGVIPDSVPRCSGIVVSEVFEGSRSSLKQWLDQAGVPGICGIDTREVVKKVRRGGMIRGVITASPSSKWKWENPLSPEWVHRVSVTRPVSYPSSSDTPHIVVVDLGHKKSILDLLMHHPCRVTMVPVDWPPEKIMSLKPDGLLFSNGPGDPKAFISRLPGWVPLIRQLPSFGIGLGHQLLALALGGDTWRLPNGHRGNQHPVRNIRTGKVLITSQNHSYAVREDSLDPCQWKVTYRHVQDGSVEGIAHRMYPVTSVQFHPDIYFESEDTIEWLQPFWEAVCTGKKVEMYG